MKRILFFFEVHQPRRIKKFFGKESIQKLDYFDDNLNKEIFQRVAKNCYIPTLEIFLENAKNYNFKFSLGLSGIFLEQCSWWEPKIIEIIKKLIDENSCELVTETYYHSLSYLINEKEFIEQIKLHKRIIKEIFGVEPMVVENTEFIYDNKVAKIMENLGFKMILTEGVDRILGWRSPNYLYKAKDSNILLLMRNYRLSDDIGFRFTLRNWNEWPLTAEKYAKWLSLTPGDIIFIAMDIETFGEHYWPESGIHDFIKALPRYIENMKFSIPSDIISDLHPLDEIDVKETISWADVERDLSAWLGNEMQKYCFEVLKYLEPMVKSIGGEYLRTWRYLTTSDHFHYMCTKEDGAKAVHSYFSHFNGPIEAFISFTWVLADLRYKVYDLIKDKMFYYRILFEELPDSHSFHFYSGFARSLGIKARNLVELYNVIKEVDEEVLNFHMRRNDFSKWINDVFGLRELSREIKNAKNREELIKILEKTIKEAEKMIYKHEEFEVT